MTSPTTTSLADGTMVDRMAHFDLNYEIADAATRKPWAAGHYAKTLFKKHDFRVVLITMEPGAQMKEHHADGTISMQVLNGKVRMNIGGKAHELSAGNLFTLAASIRHDVEAPARPEQEVLAQIGAAILGRLSGFDVREQVA